jgi:uncharacterized protein YybS (DUF2232 family)
MYLVAFASSALAGQHKGPVVRTPECRSETLEYAAFKAFFVIINLSLYYTPHIIIIITTFTTTSPESMMHTDTSLQDGLIMVSHVTCHYVTVVV